MTEARDFAVVPDCTRVLGIAMLSEEGATFMV
jgi:hypothetical protein